MFLQKILIMERVLRDSGLLSPAVPNGGYGLEVKPPPSSPHRGGSFCGLLGGVLMVHG